MIPLRDENPTELRPFVTVLFILLNVAAWVMLQGAGMPAQLEGSFVMLRTSQKPASEI